MLGTITASRLNVRSQPDQHSNKLGEIVKGTVVNILAQKNGWYEILYNKLPGFLFGQYVDLRDDSITQAGIITARLLNIRERPDTSSPILGTLGKGSKIDVISSNQNWVEFSFKESSAYLARDYVELHLQESLSFGKVTVQLLNVRQSPSLSAPVIGQVKLADKLEIISSVGEWLEIRFNKINGFAAAQYINTNADEEIPPTIPIGPNQIEEEPERPAVSRESVNDGFEPTKLISEVGGPEERKVAATWNRYGGLLEDLSQDKQIDVACTVAVLCVESSGRGFSSANNDRMIIRFENHKFWKYWGKQDPEKFRRHFRYNSGKAWTGHQWRADSQAEWQSFHGRQNAEWEVLDFARSIDNDAALLSISMGAPQIMGFHYQAIGYQSVQEMFDDFNAGIKAHIEGLFNFMSPAMIQHLQRLKFESFAGLYNGSGQKKKYGRWIKNHYDAFKRRQ